MNNNRKGIKGAKGRGTIYPMQKGQTLNPNGRPRKLATKLAIEGYTKSQISETFEKLAALKMDELKEFMENQDITVIEKGVCKMITDFFNKGKTEFLDYLLPKKQPKLEVVAKVTDYEIPEDNTLASQKYQELMKNG